MLKDSLTVQTVISVNHLFMISKRSRARVTEMESNEGIKKYNDTVNERKFNMSSTKESLQFGQTDRDQIDTTGNRVGTRLK